MPPLTSRFSKLAELGHCDMHRAPLRPPVAAHYVPKTVGKWVDATTPAMYLIGAAATTLYLWDEGRRSKTFTRLGRIGEVCMAVLESILERVVDRRHLRQRVVPGPEIQ